MPRSALFHLDATAENHTLLAVNTDEITRVDHNFVKLAGFIDFVTHQFTAPDHPGAPQTVGHDSGMRGHPAPGGDQTFGGVDFTDIVRHRIGAGQDQRRIGFPAGP